MKCLTSIFFWPAKYQNKFMDGSLFVIVWDLPLTTPSVPYGFLWLLAQQFLFQFLVLFNLIVEPRSPCWLFHLQGIGPGTPSTNSRFQVTYFCFNLLLHCTHVQKAYMHSYHVLEGLWAWATWYLQTTLLHELATYPRDRGPVKGYCGGGGPYTRQGAAPYYFVQVEKQHNTCDWLLIRVDTYSAGHEASCLWHHHNYFTGYM
jgi:hypothetical protein